MPIKNPFDFFSFAKSNKDLTDAYVETLMKKFQEKHGEMVECLVCKALEQKIPIEKIELVSQHQGSAFVVFLRIKP